MPEIVWTGYLQYRSELRGFDLSILEQILRHSSERYFDTASGRLIVVGRHKNELLVIPYEVIDDAITPVTVHVTTRQQIRFRLNTGRFTNG